MRLHFIALCLAMIPGLSWTPFAAAQPVDAVPIGPACLVTLDPLPTPPVGKPADTYNVPGDYRWLHSSVHLQGLATHEKWAPGFYQPLGTAFSDFRTAVIVDNPSETAAITVNIEYYDMGGTLLGTTPGVTIGPRCYYSEQATTLSLGGGQGSIRVVSENGTFVGATVHHSYTFAGLVDPDFLRPGMASMQQLQAVQDSATTLYGGPFPVTTVGGGGLPLDPYPFNIGNLPVFQVVNPNGATNNLLVSFASPALGGVFNTALVTLPPFGSTMDLFLFNALVPIYLTSPPLALDLDVVVTVQSLDGLPILGESLMIDVFDENLSLDRYLRMGSSELASTPALSVVNPELTFQPTGPQVRTLMSIANVSNNDIGPVRIEYRNQAGVLVGTDTLATFPAGATQRIAPGQPGIVSYPTPIFDGTVRVVACVPGLVGWTMRASDRAGAGSEPWFHKVWGEPLENTMGLEPGNGVAVTLTAPLTGTAIRKVAPIERIASPSAFPNWWPNYVAIANLQSSNIGNYWFRSFRPLGGNSCGETTNFVPQPFAGLPFGQAALTFIDGPNRLAAPPFTSDHVGLVDRRQGRVFGIDVIGDPLWEWGLGFPPFSP